MRNNYVRNLTLSALMLALCMVLPLLTGQIPQIGAALSPLHLPVLLCGFICGPWYALMVGLIAPLLRFVIFGMPPIFPSGVGMCFELATYGVVSGLLYRALPRKTGYIYVSLICAMLVGRVVWGVVRVILAGVSGSSFTLAYFLSAGFTSAIPGIILQLVLIPIIVIALQKAGLMRKEGAGA